MDIHETIRQTVINNPALASAYAQGDDSAGDSLAGFTGLNISRSAILEALSRMLRTPWVRGACQRP